MLTVLVIGPRRRQAVEREKFDAFPIVADRFVVLDVAGTGHYLRF